MNRTQVRTILKEFLSRKTNLSTAAAALAAVPVRPKDQPAAVTLESLLQQYAAGYLSTDQFLQLVGGVT